MNRDMAYRRDAITHPPTQIHNPKLLDLRAITTQAANARRVRVAFELTLRSAMNGQSYKLTLWNPKERRNAGVELHSIGEVELRQHFSADCAILSVFRDRKSIEFSSELGFLSAIHSESCELVEVQPGPKGRQQWQTLTRHTHCL
jgi:hypothetical protein